MLALERSQVPLCSLILRLRWASPQWFSLYLFFNKTGQVCLGAWSKTLSNLSVSVSSSKPFLGFGQGWASTLFLCFDGWLHLDCKWLFDPNDSQVRLQPPRLVLSPEICALMSLKVNFLVPDRLFCKRLCFNHRSHRMACYWCSARVERRRNSSSRSNQRRLAWKCS